MKREGLLKGHLENVSGKVLQQYPDIVRELIHRQHGIYALYKRGKLQYVGLASSLRNRLTTHLRDRHKGTWDRFSVYLTIKSEHTGELESLLLRIFNPSGNRVRGGRFPKSTDLLPTMKRRVRETQDNQLASLFGGKTADTLRRSRARRLIGSAALAGYSDRRQELRASYKGISYKASLLRDGQLRLNGKLYGSLTAAAKAITKRAISGWSFWRAKNAKGEWIPLRKIRK